MDITGEYTIQASKQEVWNALNDPEVLKVCVPGCQELEKISKTEFTAKIVVKIGVVKAKMTGEVKLSDMNAPNSYTISGSGKGGVAGFANGKAKVSLAEAPEGGTLLSYTVHAELGGKLAAVGSRVIIGVAKKMSDDFFGKFAKVVSGDEDAAIPATKETSVKPVSSSPIISHGIPDWVKCAMANAIVSTVAVIVAVALVAN